MDLVTLQDKTLQEILSVGEEICKTLAIVLPSTSIRDRQFEMFKAGLQVFGVKMFFPVLPQKEEGPYYLLLWTGQYDDNVFSSCCTWGKYTLGLERE